MGLVYRPIFWAMTGEKGGSRKKVRRKERKKGRSKGRKEIWIR